jgi:hypothetical protein
VFGDIGGYEQGGNFPYASYSDYYSLPMLQLYRRLSRPPEAPASPRLVIPVNAHIAFTGILVVDAEPEPCIVGCPVGPAGALPGRSMAVERLTSCMPSACSAVIEGRLRT